MLSRLSVPGLEFEFYMCSITVISKYI